MKIYDYSNIKKLYVIGDIHGDFEPFFNNIKKFLKYKKIEEQKTDSSLFLLQKTENDLYNNSVIIVCGDCGFGFNKFQYYNDILTKYNTLFNKTNTHIIFVRGNHDDPTYFADELINMSNIKTIPDYSVVKTEETNTLCVGGAISVDRVWRKQQEVRINKYSKNYFKKLFWENENVVVNENILEELKNNDIKITSVVTHTAPSFCIPVEKNSAIGWFKIDTSLSDELDGERKTMDWLYNELIKEHELYFWAYGHFHIDNINYVNKTVWIANQDNLVLTSPMLKYKQIVMNEETNNKKKRKRKKNNNDEMTINYDDLHEELERFIFNENNNEGVNENLEEAPF